MYEIPSLGLIPDDTGEWQTASSATRPAVGWMAPSLEPGIVTRLLETLEVYRTAASELFLAVCAICGLAVLVRVLIAHLA